MDISACITIAKGPFKPVMSFYINQNGEPYNIGKELAEYLIDNPDINSVIEFCKKKEMSECIITPHWTYLVDVENKTVEVDCLYLNYQEFLIWCNDNYEPARRLSSDFVESVENSTEFDSFFSRISQEFYSSMNKSERKRRKTSFFGDEQLEKDLLVITSEV